MLKQLIDQIENVKQQLYAKILSLPENDKITILSEHPKCFTVKFSDVIGKPFNAEYYDFKAQYKILVELLKNTTTENFENCINNAIETGKVRHNNVTYNLNPEVVKYLKSIV
jgi:hypothetical protein